MLGVLALLFFLLWIRLQRQLSWVDRQTRAFETLCATVKKGAVPHVVAKHLQKAVSETPSADWLTTDSRAVEIVKRSRAAAIREMVDSLRATTSSDVGDDPQAWIDRYGHLTPEDRAQFTAISAGIRRATSLTVYEGLPDSSWDSALHSKELREKKTTQRHDFQFYEPPLQIDPNDAEQLRTLICAEETFESHYSFVLMTYWFHADYCLAWQDGEATYELLFNSEFNEGRFFGPAQDLLLNVRGDALKAVLGRYRKQRPSPRED